MQLDNSNIAVLILAAGASTRMGQVKQLLPWKNTTLIGHAIEQARSVSHHVNVVLGAHAAQIEPILPDDVKTLINTSWESGMGISIACGAKYLLKTETEIQVALIMLADQPLIATEYLQQMIAAFEEDTKIVATDYGDKLGVPALFDSSLFQELAKLNGTTGARTVIQKYRNATAKIIPKGKEVDVDTPKVYEQLLKDN